MEERDTFSWGFALHPYPLSERFSAISSGTDHTCAIRKDDEGVVCWGSGEYGQSSPPNGERFIGLESESEPEDRTAPDVPLVTITSGDEHACGLDGDGVAHRWGNNEYGRSTPPAGERFLSLDSGEEHTCGLRLDRSVVCWGVDDYGQASPPEDAGPFTSVSNGGWLTCALRQGGGAVCWGERSQGRRVYLGGERFTSLAVGSVMPAACTKTAVHCVGELACGMRPHRPTMRLLKPSAAATPARAP